jgi:DNA repair exonuclease SbcCD ATPase subunit
MRICRLKVENFRIHHSFEVNFDPRLTLISGPNESGKSTLVHALHCALFLRAKGNSKEHKALKSRLHVGDPAVELEFELGPRRFVLSKAFKGASGVTMLSEKGGMPLRDSAAEERLSELLAQVGTGGWDVLFVLQGASGENPLELVADSDHLMQRLRNLGGAVVTASALDGQLAAAISDVFAETYTTTGAPRRNSDLDQATSRRDELRLEHERAAKREAALQNSAEIVEQAEQVIAEKDEILGDLARDLEQAEAALLRARELQASQSRLENELALRQSRLKEVTAAGQQIAQLEAAQSQATAELEPLQTELAALKSRILATTEALAEANRLADEASEELRQRRLEGELATATRERLEQELRMGELSSQLNALQELKAEVTALSERQAAVPNISDRQVQELAAAESRVREQQAAVSAMGARVRVLAAESPVTIAGEAHEAGAEVVLTNDSEVSYGSSLRLIVSPGGEEGLQAAVTNLREAEVQFRELLAERGVISVGEAASFARERETLGLQLKAAQKRLKELKPNELEQARTEAAVALSQARSRTELLRGQLSAAEEPTTAEAARSWLVNCERARDSAETAQRQREGDRKRQQERLNQCTAERSEKEEAIASRTQLSARQAGELQSLLRTWGEAAARAAVRTTLESEIAGLNEQLQGVRESLRLLAPDELQQRSERLTQSRERNQTVRQEAEHRLIAARALLQREETEDPVGESERARVRLEQAEEHLAGVDLKARAFRRLHELFQEEKQRAAEQYTENLRNRIADYLQRMYGPGAQVQVKMSEDGLSFKTVAISRPEQRDTEFEFETLSGGASEQVAAATRLAVAEILAGEYGGSLPIVFDDAFTQSDPDRILKLQDMLYLAAERGLQVIVLSCAPRDYGGLGAKNVVLQPLRTVAGSRGAS